MWLYYLLLGGKKVFVMLHYINYIVLLLYYAIFLICLTWVCVTNCRRGSVFDSCQLPRSASERWGQYLAGSSLEGVCTRLAKQRPAERASESVRALNRSYIIHPWAFSAMFPKISQRNLLWARRTFRLQPEVGHRKASQGEIDASCLASLLVLNW